MGVSISYAAKLIGGLKKGVKERASEKKKAACRVTIRIASAVLRGDHDEANRIREEYYPEKAAARALKAQAGL